MRRTPVAMLMALSMLAGCDPREADQLMVRIVDGTGGRLVVPDDLDAFEVRVASLEGPLDGGTSLVRYRRSFRLAGPGERTATVTLPQTLAIVPDGEAAGTVRVDVYGLKNGRVLQHIHRIAAFGVGLVELPPFALTPLCFGVECPPGQTCEADGTCGDAVDPCAGGRCDAGAVACPGGTVRCSGACVDVSTDESNCGGCGIACSAPNATSECRLGACELLACSPGFHDCDGAPANGCETPDCVDEASCTTSCGSTGEWQCAGDACTSRCDPPAEIECNGVDDDCDGTVDGCNLGGVCFRGACAYPPDGCDAAHVRDDHLYGVCDEPADWFIADEVCFRWGGYLVTPDDAAEDAWIHGIAPGTRWIAYEDITGTWTWNSPGTSYEGWCGGQPDDDCCYPEFPGCSEPGLGEDCAITDPSCGGWSDEHCCTLHGFVCELD